MHASFFYLLGYFHLEQALLLQVDVDWIHVCFRLLANARAHLGHFLGVVADSSLCAEN